MQAWIASLPLSSIVIASEKSSSEKSYGSDAMPIPVLTDQISIFLSPDDDRWMTKYRRFPIRSL
jgi:hypothetical protein